MHLRDLHREALGKHPEKIALIIDDTEMSFGQLESMADSFARTLAGQGVVPGDRVGFFMANRVELAGLYMACFRMGAVAAPMSCYNKPPETAYELNHCQAKLLLVEPELYAGVQDMAAKVPSLKKVLMVGGEPARPEASWTRAAAEAVSDLPAFDPSPDPPAVILYTSGSTGMPKGVTHTSNSLYHCTIHRCRALAHTAEDRYFITSYLCHGSALSSVFLPMLHVGGTTILTRHWSPEGFFECLRRRRPSVTATAPTQLKSILSHPDCRREDFSSIRYFHVGGDAVPRALFDAFHEKTGLELSVALGMTECGGYLVSPLSGEVKRGSMGRPTPGTEVRLVDADGREVPEGEIGEIIVQSKTLMRGYWEDPENTARTIRNGWLYTGDLARRDEEGWYYFVGRSKHCIIRDMGNVSPSEVESVISAHPKVKASGVAGIPDPEHGQAIVAFIVPEDPDDPPREDALTAFARSRISDRKVPQVYRIVDSIPLTPLSKVDRQALREMAEKLAASA